MQFALLKMKLSFFVSFWGRWLWDGALSWFWLTTRESTLVCTYAGGHECVLACFLSLSIIDMAPSSLLLFLWLACRKLCCKGGVRISVERSVYIYFDIETLAFRIHVESYPFPSSWLLGFINSVVINSHISSRFYFPNLSAMNQLNWV